ncbi:NAD(P)/FAD-dependent oxidoreductase [Poseidonocella sp. HB161398]|uniref:flavin-containing monooxygenase n=1 Tax=Poseidonocella sp. HB161398 TaxID=2320855 RepID=UPI001107E193|nr:NAD(P)/FAD-dependent oxidoreductase [Poseidonocella sp. HB161398]
MPVEKTEVLVVGAGQAGIAMSEHLGRMGIPHLVLERARIAERWRSERWDSLVANGPAWHDRFPGMEFEGHSPDAFVPKEEIADYFARYASKIGAPVRCGVDVTSVTPLEGRAGFRVETSEGTVEAGHVVAATGPFQKPVIPAIVPEEAGIAQMHSAQYRNPGALPEGAVLVVGAGASGAQIAQELMEAGRKVFLAVGPHDRPPRRYRDRDFVWWLGVLNKWDMATRPGAEHVTFAASGVHGGQTVDFRRLAQQGVTLLGKADRYEDGRLGFTPDLAESLAYGDANYLAVLREADDFVARNGLHLPEEPEAHEILPDPACVTDPVLSLDLAAEGIGAIIWATGFSQDYSWLPPAATGDDGRPAHERGVCVAEPGIYFLGLPWQTRRGSSFIWGVWHDAGAIADHISKQQGYLAYEPARATETA